MTWCQWCDKRIAEGRGPRVGECVCDYQADPDFFAEARARDRLSRRFSPDEVDRIIAGMRQTERERARPSLRAAAPLDGKDGGR